MNNQKQKKLKQNKPKSDEKIQPKHKQKEKRAQNDRVGKEKYFLDIYRHLRKFFDERNIEKMN